MHFDSDSTLVLGTHNVGKRRELQDLLGRLGFRLLTLNDFDQAIDVEETGTTFAENAVLKASQQARVLNHWVLGEDSGICVDALDGGPGVYSKRFAGEDGSDEANNRLLLEKLADIELPLRTAHYVCHMALADPSGEIVVQCEGICRGRIRFEPEGQNGFGYDPLFEVREYHRTFGELGDAVKRVISHRARANTQLLHALSRFTAR